MIVRDGVVLLKRWYDSEVLSMLWM